MSEMRGVDTTKLENEQAQTTKGLEETTKAVKGVESTIADGDRSVSAKLSMIGRVLSIESPAEKAARQQSQEQASAAAANFQRLIQLQAQGNATDEQVLAAQEQMEQTASEAAEAAEKRSMFDRFGGDEAPAPPPAGGDDGGDAADEGGGFMKTFGKFFKMIKGFVGILLAVAIPALALLLNSPVFEVLKKALFDFIDYIFDTVIPFIKNEVLPAIKKFYNDFIIPIKDFVMKFLFSEGGGIDIMLELISKQWENVKKLFNSMLDLFDNLMKGDFAAAFGNLGDIGKILMDAIDEALTAILKLGLAAFGLTFDGSIGDLISNWLTSTWESIKGALRSVFESVGFDAPEMLQAGSAEQRADTAAAQGDIEAAEDEKKAAQRGMRGAGREEKFSGRLVERRRAKLAELEKEAEEKGGFDKLEQSKTFGLDKNDIIKARKQLEEAEERERKAKEKTAMLNKQLADAETKKAEAEERLANVGKKVQKDADARDKATTLRELPPSEAEKAAEVNKAANDNKASNIVVQQNDQSSTAQTEQKTVIEQNKPLSPDARTSKLLDSGVF
jgi:hypothetical protein